MALNFTVPGLDEATSEKVVAILQSRLSQEQETALILKHAHWNMKGKEFIGIHEMMDPEVDSVLNMADETAERIATLGGSPAGRPDDIMKNRDWDGITMTGRQDALDYLKALDTYYTTFIKRDREAIEKLDDLDAISSNIVQDHVQELEHFQWFMRSHLF
ncbi:DNA starvation/stationary phase protection protein [Bifidobacterium sp. W8109]|uniref:Dps family protein n=1 Tax=Bifidobacterium TaxID=1678 RepID=UPI0018DBC16B|nr:MULTISPECIES: DNA starvation/stationary phase protection protein [Bifidobacterium]MBH9972058.1 DNA starvation/stationary phase protection protein [Bifidobacterium asteroides]MBI0073771.1 DNA starvation/stationary phase protection protein [Bifidobacterium sp. W8110]